HVLKSIKKGIGEAKNQGFGEIDLFNFGAKFIKEEIEESKPVASEELSDDEKAWLTWLKPVSIGDNVENIVRNGIKDFVSLCKSIKTFQSFDDDFVFWPGSAQWGRVLEVARNCKTKDDLIKQLFDSDNAVIKSITETQTELNNDTREHNPDKEWNYEAFLRTGDNKTINTLREWLKAFVEQKNLSDKERKLALQELAKKCRNKVSDKNWLNNEKEKEGSK
ncbi:MAG: hypothetical protein K6G09_05710, partial [Treponema sp.]|nr:hypothetical protein [Treponema sp.]